MVGSCFQLKTDQAVKPSSCIFYLLNGKSFWVWGKNGVSSICSDFYFLDFYKSRIVFYCVAMGHCRQFIQSSEFPFVKGHGCG